MRYFIIIIFIFLFSCKSNQTENKKITNTDSIKQKSIDSTSIHNNNTKGKYYTITDITKDQYDKTAQTKDRIDFYYDYFRLNNDGQETEKYLLQKYSSIAKRVDKKLDINTKVGVKNFIDKVSKNPDMDANDSSQFLIALTKDFAVLQIVYHESDGANLIDLNTGQNIVLWGLTYPSPSGKQILSTSIDPEGNMQVNGIQFIASAEGKWKIKWEEELDGWSVTEPIWIDENTILFKEERIAAQNGDLVVSYKKMILL